MSVQTLEGEVQALRAQVKRLQADLAAARSDRHDADQLSREKDEFLAMVAHELRAPLAAIVGWTHMLREEGKDATSRMGWTSSSRVRTCR
jgi:signal transduction histidine kinase